MQSRKSARCLAFAVLAVAPLAYAANPIVFDGSLGRAGRVAQHDGVYSIPSSRGSIAGSNLFQSFSRFNVPAGSTIELKGPARVQRIIIRVTGPDPSAINGTLVSRIAGSALWLFNPSGIVFGAGASVQVDGSFVASTASELHFPDSTKLTANNTRPSLTVSAPDGFGFTSPRPASLTMQGTHLVLSGSRPHALVGGNVQLNQSSVQSSGGGLALVSVAGAGDVRLPQQGGAFKPSISGGVPLGTVQLAGKERKSGGVIVPGTLVKRSNIDVASHSGGGEIDVLANNLNVFVADLIADTRGSGDGRGINVNLTGDFNLTGGQVHTDTHADGDAGPITINARNVRIAGDNQIINIIDNNHKQNLTSNIPSSAAPVRRRYNTQSQSGVEAYGSGISARSENKRMHGAGGDITINADNLSVLDGAGINTTTYSRGAGGNIFANITDQIDLRNNALIREPGRNPNGAVKSINGRSNQHLATRETGLFARARGGISADGLTELANPGNGGSIFVRAKTVLMSLGALISTTSRGNSHAGDIHIDTDALSMSDKRTRATRTYVGPETWISSQSEGQIGRDGSGGDIFIVAGKIKMTADLPAHYDNQGTRLVRITTSTQNASPAGNIHITANSLEMTANGDGGGAEIVASSGNGQQKQSRPNFGSGGSLDLQIKSIQLDDKAQILASSSTSNAGSIRISGVEELTLNQGTIAANASLTAITQGRRNQILLGRAYTKDTDREAAIVNQLIREYQQGKIGNAGDVDILATGTVSALSNSTISANAQRNGGNIMLSIGQMLRLNQGTISATAAGGNVNAVGDGGNVSLLAFTPGNHFDDGLPSAGVINGITASSEQGHGGRISSDVAPAPPLASQATATVGNTLFSVTSGTGQPGQLSINNAIPDFAELLTPLFTSLQSPEARLHDCCELKLTRDLSSFVQRGVGGLPLDAEGWTPVLDLNHSPTSSAPATQPSHR